LNEKPVSSVLVTGGAGFIGSHVVDGLVRAGYSVKVLDNLSAGRLENLGLHLSSGVIQFFEGDIRDRALAEKLCQDVDAVVHLAALVSVPLSVKDPKSTFDVNVNGTSNLLYSCSSENVRKVVFASSCAVYGAPKYLPIDEEHPTRPLSPYASSKLEGEHVCEEFSECSHADVVIFRLFNVYGSRQASSEYGGVITKFMDRVEQGKPLVVYGDGSQTRDFVYVSDVVQAILMVLGKNHTEGTFNVGFGEAVSVETLAKKVLELKGKDVGVVHEPSRPGDIEHSQADVFKAQQEFGFSAKVGLDEGLRRLIRERSLTVR
jgi:UDP-glucose 4-epimerase